MVLAADLNGIEAAPCRPCDGPRTWSNSLRRQCHHEAAAALGAVGRIAAVPARNLPHQSKPEAGVLRTAASWNAVECREQTLARVRGDHLAAIGNAQRGLIAMSRDCDLDWRLAMELCVLDQIADHSAQQRRVSPHHDGMSLHATILVACAFLG